jgi:hypothetical protein
VSAEVGGGDGSAGPSARWSAIEIAPGAGSVQSSGEAARAGDQTSAVMAIKGRIETSVAGDLTMVVRFANGERLDSSLFSAR